MLKITFIGDVVPGGILSYFRNEPAVSKSIYRQLRQSDIVVATLESPLGGSNTMSGDKKNIIYTPAEDFFRLKELNISVVSLANNHVLDLSEEGFVTTLQLLESNNIRHCGAGRNLTEARAPAFIEKNGLKVGFLAYCKQNYRFVGKVHAADEKNPGMAPLETSMVLEDIRKVRPECDLLYLILHWGIEYTWLPTPESMDMATLFIRNGADGIIGGHPHRIQPYRYFKNKPVIYSLGNFLFPNIIITPPKLMAYPDGVNAKNYTSLPRMNNYQEVDCATLRIWKPLSRIGMIVKIKVEKGSQRMKVRLTRADKYRSVLSEMNRFYAAILKLFLFTLGLGIRLPIYRFVFHRILKLY